MIKMKIIKKIILSFSKFYFILWFLEYSLFYVEILKFYNFENVAYNNFKDKVLNGFWF